MVIVLLIQLLLLLLLLQGCRETNALLPLPLCGSRRSSTPTPGSPATPRTPRCRPAPVPARPPPRPPPLPRPCRPVSTGRRRTDQSYNRSRIETRLSTNTTTLTERFTHLAGTHLGIVTQHPKIEKSAKSYNISYTPTRGLRRDYNILNIMIVSSLWSL